MIIRLNKWFKQQEISELMFQIQIFLLKKVEFFA